MRIGIPRFGRQGATSTLAYAICHCCRLRRYKTFLPVAAEAHQTPPLLLINANSFFTDMALSLPSVVVSAVVLYVLWKIFYPYFTTLTIDNLPGPPPRSWWLGTTVTLPSGSLDH